MGTKNFKGKYYIIENLIVKASNRKGKITSERSNIYFNRNIKIFEIFKIHKYSLYSKCFLCSFGYIYILGFPGGKVYLIIILL